MARLILDSVLGRAVPAGSVVVEESEWPALWAALRTHRVGPSLASLLEARTLVLPGRARDAVRAEATAAGLGFLQLSAAAASAQKALADSGIEALVLKGLATGNLDYPEGWIRHTGDVDLLCRPSDFGRAVEVLRASGSTDRKRGTPVDLLVEETLVTRDGVELDIHHRLFRFGPPGDSLLFTAPVKLPDGLGAALDREARLVHAAGHLLLSPPGTRRLSSLVDVALLSGSRELDEDLVERLSNEFGIRDVVEFSRWLADSIGKDDAPGMPDRGLSLVNSAHIRTDRSVWMETLALLRDQGSVRRQTRYLAYQARRFFRR